MNKIVVCCLCLVSLLSPGVLAALVSGQVEVMKKGGRRAFDSAEYAVVYLNGVNGAITTKASEAAIKINQKNKRFFPRLMPIVKGQTVQFFNQDELDHNVFSTEEKNSFDLGRYPKGDFREVTYDQAGNYKVYCNIHQKMILDIVVLDNQYFAMTDEKGNFAIDNVPPGEYQLNIWHIYGGKSTKTVTVGENGLQLAAMQVVSTKVVRDVQKHKNKHGKKYKKKGRYRR